MGFYQDTPGVLFFYDILKSYNAPLISDKYSLPTIHAKRKVFLTPPHLTTTMSSTPSATFEWNLKRFPDSRLATNVIKNPQALVAALFDVPEYDLLPTIPSVATYDTVFDQVQQCIVATKNISKNGLAACYRYYR
jgi:hypothetical protein